MNEVNKCVGKTEGAILDNDVQTKERKEKRKKSLLTSFFTSIGM